MKYELLDKDKLKIFVDSEEDIVPLFIFLQVGDIIEGWDYRTIKVNENRKEKVKVWIKIQIEKIKLSEFRNSIRVNGRILEASDIVHGKYHTFEIGVGTSFVLHRKISKYDLDFLEKNTKHKIIYVLAIDDRNIALAKLTNKGYQILYSKSLDLPKDDPNRESLYFKYISEALNNVPKNSFLVICGPIFYPKRVKEYIESKKDWNFKIFTAYSSHGGEWGIRELLKRRELTNILKEINILNVNLVIQDFIKSIYSGYAVMGIEKVLENAEYGNLEYVIIDFDFFRRKKEEGDYEDIIRLIKTCYKFDIKFYFAYENNEYYETISKFGVVGKLKYKY